MLPELREEGAAEADLSKEFSSEDSVVSLQETVALLERHGLLVEQVDSGADGEMLV
jgi:UDP-glucose 4-epimerase